MGAPDDGYESLRRRQSMNYSKQKKELPEFLVAMEEMRATRPWAANETARGTAADE
jgi:hypothetical protein